MRTDPPERLENLSGQLPLQVDIALGTIRKPDAEHVTATVFISLPEDKSPPEWPVVSKFR